MNKLLILLLFSCTSITYQSKGLIPTYLSKKDKHVNIKEAHIEKEFYLWGKIPTTHQVFIDETLGEVGVRSAASIQINEYQSFSNLLVGLITFGMYWPIDVKISCLAKEEDD